ncbi:TetR/AcrR family transcriptional regulator [Amycolatopsis sp. OK19-0408]|uniref:TetR/AcrR family transcriptional regulator n=1 Tax=Amycolatopsis iheyensis TaxID=2945988 RepID=A0A9X2NLE2_9PSEU|nr:TetR/AcrR family transcriptional regulator [Amycolatopsis iheyensis]MCR6488462.1 TetR/AcrR family transcriptional regulator [Amycolatopsis iheyensis]
MAASGPRGPYAKGTERREQILRTALEVFTEGGYHGSSVKEIARRVGVTESTLFHYFGSKQAMLAAVLAARDERTAALLGGGDPLPGLLEATRRNAQTPDLVRLYATTSAEATEPGHAAHEWVRDRYGQVRDDLAGRLADRVPPGADPAWVARILVAVMDGLQVQWLLDDRVDMGKDLERLAALLVVDRTPEGPGAPGPA